MTVTCTNSTTYTIGLGPGLASGATVTTRQMQNGSALLNYGLFSNGTWTTNWGNTSGTNWVSGTGNGSGQAITVYGQIPAGQYDTWFLRRHDCRYRHLLTVVCNICIQDPHDHSKLIPSNGGGPGARGAAVILFLQVLRHRRNRCRFCP